MDHRKEPKIMCNYANLALSDLIADAEKYMEGLLPGEILRLVTEDIASRVVIPAWCYETGNRLLTQDECCTLVRNGDRSLGIRSYTFDIQRS
jgi:TusA-related sulfurtransferase